MRAASSGQPVGQHPLATTKLFSVDEQVLSMNAEVEQQRSVAVIDVPFAAIAGV
jgi:hypothetical protein